MRTSVLHDWISSKTKVVVATVAFGYVFLLWFVLSDMVNFLILLYKIFPGAVDVILVLVVSFQNNQN